MKKIALGLLGVWVLTSVVGTEAFRTASSQKLALTVLGTTPNWSYAGESSGDQLGSASAACYINEDGYIDLVVGAPGYTGLDPQGAVYVHYGSAAGLGAGGPPLALLGDVTGAATHFGGALACADVNGDGYADVIVGEYGYSYARGIAYVYLGTPLGLSTTHALTLTGPGTTNGDLFGYSVAGLGDVNGDGYADFAVGTPEYNGGQGKVFYYLGNSDLDAIIAQDLVGSGGAFGKYVASAGDVNGDGLAEAMIGAPEGNGQPGRAFVYLGTSAGLSATSALTLTGEAANDYFGQSGGMAGDVNGDGYADLIIGASGYLTSTGRAYAYLGSSAGLSATPAITLTGEATGDNFGRSIGTMGDVNGGGYADVVIGADGYSFNRGRAYLYLGSRAGLSATAGLTLTGQTGSERFGANVGWAGDVNGDGYTDIAIGAPGYSASKGAINVYYGSAFLPSANPQRVFTGEVNDRLGGAAATAGDVNGDGFADVMVGAKGAVSDRGQAYLFLGSSSGLSATSTLTLTGENPNDLFGSAVATAGDVDSDGYADVIVGANAYAGNQGRAYLYLGNSAGLGATPVLTVSGQSSGDQFGASVATAGDVNGDGYADFIVGASGYMTNTGQAYLYLGSSAGLSSTPAITLTGDNKSDRFGSSLAAAGDVNGDGYADFIVGASGYMTNTGRAYLYLGSSAGLSSTPALTLTGQSPGDYFGASVGTAGDVNADAYADFVVGAPQAGRVYAFAGGAVLLDTPPITLTGGSPGDDFGDSAGTAGDVNGDGFSDIIVGADADNGNQGRAYLYLGGSLGVEATPVLTLTGEGANAYFGSAAGTAGDVNGDGFADLLVGSVGFGDDEHRGRAYLHLGNGGGGKDTLAQAERPKDGLLIQPWGLSRTPYGFEVSLAASDPMGRGRLKLQAEICLPGEAFSEPTTCTVQTSPIWQDVAASPTVTLTITDLAPGTLYRWRARLLHAPFSVTGAGAPPNPAHGPWRRFLAQSQEADVKTARLYWMYLPLIGR